MILQNLAILQKEALLPLVINLSSKKEKTQKNILILD
jgi:hypothetical protein